MPGAGLPDAAEVLALRCPVPCAVALGPHGALAYTAHAPACEQSGAACVLLRAWQLRTGVCAWEARLPCPDPATLLGLVATHDGAAVLAAWSNAADVAVFAACDGALLPPLSPSDGADGSANCVTALALSADGARLCVARGLRIDVHEPAAGGGFGRRLRSAASCVAVVAPGGACRISALALHGRSRLFLRFADGGFGELSLEAGAAPDVAALRSQPAAARDELHKLAFRAADPGRLLLCTLASCLVCTDAAEAPLVLSCGSTTLVAAVARGICATETGKALTLHTEGRGATNVHQLHAAPQETFVLGAASPCGTTLLAVAAAPRGCVLRRYRLRPAPRFHRAAIAELSPSLRAAIRAVLACVAFPRQSAFALLQRLDAATRDGILDAVFDALVAAAAAEHDGVQTAHAGRSTASPGVHGARCEVFPLPVPRARDCPRGLVMFHTA